ncbi:uncharacterized protein UDID_18261 [Ustilago sp. UG-2017a]|nr:uncharacterized protein UDID_18261 [Ustilago sp. UG-2017a]
MYHHHHRTHLSTLANPVHLVYLVQLYPPSCTCYDCFVQAPREADALSPPYVPTPSSIILPGRAHSLAVFGAAVRSPTWDLASIFLGIALRGFSHCSQGLIVFSFVVIVT